MVEYFTGWTETHKDAMSNGSSWINSFAWKTDTSFNGEHPNAEIMGTLIIRLLKDRNTRNTGDSETEIQKYDVEYWRYDELRTQAELEQSVGSKYNEIIKNDNSVDPAVNPDM